ncbi:MAG TPA: lamin tail domain-containing protein [Candidatus Paceibacterota bacterium]|nr:lamin tail domain-containing protein [Candidatus Paceibacterota bacterium]
MKKILPWIGYLFILFSLLVPLEVALGATSQVRINEIAWMGTTDSSNVEWIELYNFGSVPVDLSGWKLKAADGSPEVALSGSIPASGYFLLERTKADGIPGVTADLVYSGALSNSGEKLVLADASGTVMDMVDDTGGWEEGDNTAKNTMQWNGTKWITGVPTPKVKNSTEDLGQGDTGNSEGESSADASNDSTDDSETSSHSDPAALSDEIKIKKLKADAGRDRVQVAGAPIRFEGIAADGDGRLLTHANFSWNFGDGTTDEGKKVEHMYAFPGKYNVVLNVDFGGKHAVSRLHVSVVPARVGISDAKTGEKGYIEISNSDAREINLGGFVLEDSAENFTFPADTIVSGKTKIRFGNAVTGLLPKAGDTMKLLFPNNSPVFGEDGSQVHFQFPGISNTSGTTTEEIQGKLLKAKQQLLSLRLQVNLGQSVSSQPATKKLPFTRTPSSVPVKAVTPNDQNTAQKTDLPPSLSQPAQNPVSQTASAGDSVVVVRQPSSWWEKILHFFFRG